MAYTVKALCRQRLSKEKTQKTFRVSALSYFNLRGIFLPYFEHRALTELLLEAGQGNFFFASSSSSSLLPNKNKLSVFFCVNYHVVSHIFFWMQKPRPWMEENTNHNHCKREPSFFHLAVETTLFSGLAGAVLKAPGDGVCSFSHCYTITEMTDTNTKPQSFEQSD